MKSLQKVPTSTHELRASYDQLYQGWMGHHKNIDQAQRILRLLNIRPGTRLLDIGCGLGYVLDMAEAEGVMACGIDISEVALRLGKAEAATRQLVLGDAERLPWPDESFDFLVNLGSLEHFVDPATAVSEMARVMRRQGRAAVLVPNSHHIQAIYNVYRYGEILPDLQDFERFATRVEWERLLESNGLRVLAVHKYDIGMARMHRKGREVFWWLYNIFFHLFGRWIPLNLTYAFIFICARSDADNGA
jgi:ubiquinone/menaquinone biosynthesis C-methylase UbiE